MSFLDAALDGYRPPVAEDLDIALPALHGQKKEPKVSAETAEASQLGQHGGAAEGSSSNNDAHSDAAEPVPQRDEPDDGEHTDSTEQQVEARAAVAAEAAAAPDEAETGKAHAETSVSERASDDDPAVQEDDVITQVTSLITSKVAPSTVRQALADIEGSSPKTLHKTGFSSGGVETLTVTRFPQPLVDRLRLSLAPAAGGEFAEALSSAALITAFLIAKTGLELDVDPNTAEAVEVFRQVDPRLMAVEDKMDEVMQDVTQLANAMKLSLTRVSETSQVVDSLEFSMAYLVADRVAGISTAETDETNVDVTQKKVLVARESIRKRSRAQRQVERDYAGRRPA